MAATDQILARNLRTIRRALGWSQEELAHRARSGRTYVGAVEKCKQSPTLDWLQAVADCVGLDVHELLDPDTITVVMKVRAREITRE